jgi:hypothetical protein
MADAVKAQRAWPSQTWIPQESTALENLSRLEAQRQTRIVTYPRDDLFQAIKTGAFDWKLTRD